MRFSCPSRPPAQDRFESLAQWADTIVVADTSATAQLEGLGAALARYRDKLLVIDHHATTEDLGAVQFVDVSAAAAGVLACEIIEALGWPLETAAAEAMLVAITSDTGWLHFANTDARCLLAVARLVESAPELRLDKLYMKLFQCDRPERLKLMTIMLQSLELHFGGRMATMMIRRRDFEASGGAAGGDREPRQRGAADGLRRDGDPAGRDARRRRAARGSSEPALAGCGRRGRRRREVRRRRPRPRRRSPRRHAD